MDKLCVFIVVLNIQLYVVSSAIVNGRDSTCEHLYHLRQTETGYQVKVALLVVLRH